MRPRLSKPIILSLKTAGVVSIHTDSLLIPSVNQTIGTSALGPQPLKFAQCCQHAVPLNGTPHRQLLVPNLFQWGGLLPPVPSSRWPGLGPAVWQRPQSYQVMREPCHVKRKSKKLGLCSSLLQAPPCGIWHTLGQPDFLKLPCRIRIRVGHSTGGSELLRFVYFILSCVIMSWMEEAWV